MDRLVLSVLLHMFGPSLTRAPCRPEHQALKMIECNSNITSVQATLSQLITSGWTAFAKYKHAGEERPNPLQPCPPTLNFNKANTLITVSLECW